MTKEEKLREEIEHIQRKTTVDIVKQLGQEIGYGHLMSLASAHWRAHIKEDGYPESGAFIPTLIDYLQGEEKEIIEKEMKVYDNFIKENSQ